METTPAKGVHLEKFLRRIPAWITPNGLTFARMAFTPPILYIALMGYADWALPLYLILVLTDAIDGPLARLRGQTSKLGAFLDQLSDKLLQVPMILVTGYGIVPLYLLLLLATAEVLLLAMRPIQAMIFQLRGKEMRPKSHLSGKIKMWAEGFAIFFLLSCRQTGSGFLWGLSLFAVTVSAAFALASLAAQVRSTLSAGSE